MKQVVHSLSGVDKLVLFHFWETMPKFQKVSNIFYNIALAGDKIVL